MGCKRSILVLLIAMTAWLAGCRFFEGQEKSEPVDLIGTAWELIAVRTMDGLPLETPEPPGAYQLFFYPGTCAESRNACNTCFGTYRAYEGGELGLAQGCTEIACDADVYRFPGDYGDALSNAVLYWIDGDELFIQVGAREGQQVLVHHANPDAEPPRRYCENEGG